jgi:hypothetical protein
MKKANYSDKERVVKIIQESFDDNPHINYLVKKGKNREKRIAYLAKYAFETGMQKHGVYLSDNGKGVIIFFTSQDEKSTFKEILEQIKLVFKVFGFSRIFQIIKMENSIKSHRPKGRCYIYVWFMGVSNDARGTKTAWEMMKFINQLSDLQGLPILCETTVQQNKKVYNRLGYITYKTYINKISNLTCWFMQRLPMKFS